MCKNGGVWVWDPKMHGDPGWVVQFPGGGHSHAYPDGGYREHFQNEYYSGAIFAIFVGSFVTGVLVVDDIMGIGIYDDGLILGSMAMVTDGLKTFLN